MPVNIKGKQYVPVAERVAAAHDAGVESIVTEMLHYADSGIVFRATVRLSDGRTFTGHAEQSSSDAGIAGQSPLEVAETSAVGRALGFAGFGSADSIASADEVRAAPTPAAPVDPNAAQVASNKARYARLKPLADAHSIPAPHLDKSMTPSQVADALTEWEDAIKAAA